MVALCIYGKPGTGKSRIIHCLKQLLDLTCVTAAATGSAANNIGGQDITFIITYSCGK